ncbi:bifunctional (p)ppGpp synthetase/guanosine-3',5'-bis(diphosphate) 3'-pyrophosphohydrolase [Boudabousia tangfeifanii]|uniref:Bifunctional (P)ppGpp synthetase/guanosine-3',5'-bis(Diphosphate) 3'-pyrophosphohydrolase n=1 Tax=Boudabousia tangfeifanii TaxID=1912795 RepID=A0A1D9MKF6_9ACTO|nr:bifunctional (p)ppGpp synthetase/guanosine-3',5'-bis(diphosphate) 3'-pyrophosphohydrolase [Boudabousia tangfeifanii]AOZ72650.1 bifunctional (p)ppGpp synthetase/guanosine-3',5'-bis(diphosphate) 3'-pyrophosphohydrolase [Boudabousia tangfeifanii]
MSDSTSTIRDPGSVVPGSRVRSSLLRFSSRKRTTAPQIEPLVRALKAHHPKADVALIERAYETAAKLHAPQKRKSGEPYITHPVAVATILAEIGMTSTTLAAALLHDTVEDTDYTLEELTRDFGEEIALLVDGVTKLDKVKYGEAAQSETVRKMIVAMSRDIRVLVIKLGDRLHNARTWKYVSPESAKNKARETLEIYAPLAHRLGMNTIKYELEELAFKTLYPKRYEEIDHLVAERAPEREKYLKEIIHEIEEELRQCAIKGVVTGRPKHHYSIYQKMIVRGREFNEIYDLVAVRVLVENVRDCYAVLGALHAKWHPLAGRFKDYIAMPKFNMYQSLHTTVVGPGGKPIEVQIRTFDMHRRAEYGVAAHWKYKENPNATGKKSDGKVAEDSSQMGWLRQLVDWQSETTDPEEFLDSLRYEISGSQVYVFTPKGSIIALPERATPLDFAYAVHTEVGHKTIGAKVNGKLVPLDHRLENGDKVEILTSPSPKAGPSQDWIKIVASPRARNKIKQWFSRERREEAIESGKSELANAMRKQNLPLRRLLTHETLLAVATDLGYVEVSGLYAAVGEHNISAANVINRLLEIHGGDDGAEETLSEAIVPTQTNRTSNSKRPSGNCGIAVAGLEGDDVLVKLAKCCTPVPGDNIIGFITRGAGVSVHQTDCPNVTNLSGEEQRLIDVSWVKDSRATFEVQIEVEALDRASLLVDLSQAISAYHVDIRSGSFHSTPDRVGKARFTLEMAEAAHLNAIIAGLRKVPGVYDVYRVNSTANKSHR